MTRVYRNASKGNCILQGELHPYIELQITNGRDDGNKYAVIAIPSPQALHMKFDLTIYD